jgi:hypothetical protein
MQAKLQAPKGGCRSENNHEWYEGGQFMPDSCLPKGVLVRVRKAARDTRNIAELIVRGRVVLVRYAGDETEKFLFSGENHDEARMFAESLIKSKTEWYVASGFVPHPTQLSVAQ